MESFRQRESESPPPGIGITRDLARLKSDGAATAAELREFLGQMRGKSPQEVLGVIAGSGLFTSMVLATLLCLLLMAGLTVVPYLLQQRGSDAALQPDAAAAAAAKPAAARSDKKAKAGKSSPAKQPAAGEKPGAAAAAAPSKTPSGAPAETTPESVDQAVKAMGLDETKKADPKKNPLDGQLDNLLDKVH